MIIRSLCLVAVLCGVAVVSGLPTDFMPNLPHPNRMSSVLRMSGEAELPPIKNLMSSDNNLTRISLWPQPMNASTLTSHTYTINPAAFAFRSASPVASGILQRAFDRYGPLCFPWGAGNPDNLPNPTNDIIPLQSLVVTILSDNEYLGLSTNETYTLTITDDGKNVSSASLVAETVYGALRGLETFSQLIQYEQNLQTYQVASHYIVDTPRYPYRGIMVDVARHFIGVPSILATLDAMSWNKFNVMHMHLIDDQSWPLEIEAYPRLTGWTAFSNFSHVYTKNDIATIVQYAKDRGIRVIPEIDTPSHSDIIARSYPEFLTLVNCDGHDCPLGHTFRSMPDPTNPKTWAFLKTVFSEVAAMFPDEAFHIGGDEFWYAWTNAPTVQAFMKANNYTSILDVYHYYERGVIDIIRGLGKKTVLAWEDIHGFQEAHEGDNTNYDLYPDVVLDVWAGWPVNPGTWQSSFEQYTQKNAHVILTGPWYIDSRSKKISDTLWSDMYETTITNWTATTQQQDLVLGGHVCAWDDAINGDGANLLTLLFPVSSAVSEVLWSPTWVTKDEGSAHGRIHGHRCRMVQRGLPAGTVEIGYCPVEYTGQPLGPTPFSSATKEEEEEKDAKIARLQAEIQALAQENAILRSQPVLQ